MSRSTNPRRTRSNAADDITVDVLIEVPAGSRNKYEVDAETGRVQLERVIFAATRYPADYGYIPNTLAGDGDPLDALVLVDEPTIPGCHIKCRPIALLDMSDQEGADEKVLLVPAFDSRTGWRDVKDVPQPTLKEIAHFFEVYKDLDVGRFTQVKGWRGRDAALRAIDAARLRYARSTVG